MLSQRSGSYTMKHVERELRAAGKDALPSPERLLTDRGSYIAYLESQLERVSAACLTVTSFDERLEQAVGAVRALEEKTLNLARLVSCAQQFAEQSEAAQRQGAAELGRRLCALEERMAELEEPARAGQWEAKLRAVSAQVDSRLAEMGATSEARLAEAAGRLQAGLEASCHEAHVALETRLGEAAGRLTEAERKVRALDEFAHRVDSSAAVADLAGRVGSLEGSLGSDKGQADQLASLQAAVAQLKTAMVALELRPPLGDAANTAADCLQWLERAREALKREVGGIQQQHAQLAAGLNSALAAAAAAPQSPQKAVAAQVLSGLQLQLPGEVQKELQALRLADQLLESVTQQFKSSPPAGSSGATAGGAADAAAKKGAADAGSSGEGGWTIAAVPAQAVGAAAPPASQAVYPQAPGAQEAVAAAAEGAVSQLQQLAGGEQQLAQAAAALAASAEAGSGASSLRGSFSQMQQTLASVCQLLQDGDQAPRRGGAAYQAAASRYLSHSSTAQRGGSPPEGKRAWVPGGSGKPGAGAAASAAAGRSLSFGAGGGGAKGALRESVLSQAALEQRRRRLQQLYCELRQ